MLPTEPTSAGRSTRLLWLPTGKPSASIPATSSGRSGDQLADAELSMKISQLFGVLYHGTARNNLAFHPHHPAYLTSDVDEARNYASMDAEVDGGTPIVLTLKIAHPMPAYRSEEHTSELQSIMRI